MKLKWMLTASMALSANAAFAGFVDAQGHYGLSGKTETHPGFDKGKGIYQAIDQSLRLAPEFRLSDKASFFTEFRLFSDPRAATLGDTAQPRDCSRWDTTATGGTDVSNTGSANNCAGRHQNTSEPSYSAYTPLVTEAYMQYALDYCLLKAGRRSRNWGTGIFLSNDHSPFATGNSVFDGISCDINIQKSQTLALSFGYDKLTETGVNINAPATPSDETYGPTNPSDDLDQFFFTIQYDDRKANAGSAVTQNVGVYFANIIGGRYEHTDIKYADLFLNFFVQDWIFTQEVLFRLGRSADPNYSRLGGAGFYTNADSEVVAATNKLESIGLAGGLEYVFNRSGSATGPQEFSRGNLRTHSWFFEYAFAPGDKDGYTKALDANGDPLRSDTKAEAMSFHENYKPALILFNSHRQQDELRVDGVFDPNRVMNAFVWGTGYRYKGLDTGNFELKLLSAKMNQKMPGSVKALYAATDAHPVGYKGGDLGMELDLKYDTFLARNLNLGVAGGIAKPGDAWNVRNSQSPAALDMLIQSSLTFTF